MSRHSARIEWQRQPGEVYTDNRYSRRHALHFDGGAEWAGSSAPSSVPLPMSDASAVDPEEMFVAALASCHMLWFLGLAAHEGYTVERYRDDAAGVLGRNAQGRIAMTLVTLRPEVQFGGTRQPSRAELEALHHAAHDQCYIATSVTTEVRVEPRP